MRPMSSSQSLRHWNRWTCLVLVAACSSTTPKIDANGNDGGTITTVPDCSRFGLKQTAGCGDCPETPLRCDCGNLNSVSVQQRCTTWLRCVRSIDCDAVCAKTTDQGQPFVPVSESLRACEAQPPCQNDKDCLDGAGKCFHPSPTGTGVCSWGIAGSPCLTADDCVTGHCVTVGGALMCEDGQTNEPCNTGGDCMSGICAHGGACDQNAQVHTIPPPPTVRCSPGIQVCQEGRNGQFCDSVQDCQSGICVTFSGGVGTCQDGSVYSPCKSDSDCTSKHCVFPAAGMKADVPVGWCSSRGVMEPCAANADCQAGYCYTPAGTVGLCAGGELSDPCTDPSQCKSRLCVRLDPNRDGTCQSGKDPAACATNDDCLNHMCIVRPPDQPTGFGRDHQCNSGLAGYFCWTGADCLSGSCVPVPGKGPGGVCAAPP